MGTSPHESELDLSTLVIHAGQKPEATTGAVMPPIFLSSTYAQESPGRHKGFEYTRSHNPTRYAFERCIARLEGSTLSEEEDVSFGQVRLDLHVIHRRLLRVGQQEGNRVGPSGRLRYRLDFQTLLARGIGGAAALVEPHHNRDAAVSKVEGVRMPLAPITDDSYSSTVQESAVGIGRIEEPRVGLLFTHVLILQLDGLSCSLSRG